MLNETQKNKIRAFLGDKVLSETIYNVLLNSFLKETPNKDVHVLAASYLSVGLLKQSWKELERCREEPRENVEIKTPHV